MTVLVITQSDDVQTAPGVIDAIRARGARAFRLDTDRFPREVVVRHRPDGGPSSVTDGADTLDLAEVTAVWYRRMQAGRGVPKTMDEQFRRASVLEARASMLGLMASLPVFHMDHYWAVRRASNKALQLEVARSVGLEVPRTLTTNDPDAVRAFAGECGGDIITKMLASFAIFEDDQELVVFTNPVSQADLDDMTGLDLCPMTFQERIPKQLELRATVVGKEVFTASIDSPRVEGAAHDWRREGRTMVYDWKAYDLPADTRERLLALMDRFQLNYGAADFILSPEGRLVFLEMNPVGEFFWIDKVAGLPALEHAARVLTDPDARRAFSEPAHEGLRPGAGMAAADPP